VEVINVTGKVILRFVSGWGLPFSETASSFGANPVRVDHRQRQRRKQRSRRRRGSKCYRDDHQSDPADGYQRTRWLQFSDSAGRELYAAHHQRGIFGIQRRFSGGLQLEANYTWSKIIGFNTNSDSGPNFVQALAYFKLHVSTIFDLPFGSGRKFANSGLGEKILGGWQINQLWSFYTGTPFGITASGSSLNLPGATQRADQVKPSVQIFGNAGRGMSYFDPLAFAPVTDPRFGTAGYRALRGPGLVNVDFGIHRRFKIRERVNLQFRAEAFNFANTPHFSNPGTNVSNMDVTGGVIRTNGYTEITGVTNLARDGIDERQVRFTLRFQF